MYTERQPRPATSPDTHFLQTPADADQDQLGTL